MATFYYSWQSAAQVVIYNFSIFHCYFSSRALLHFVFNVHPFLSLRMYFFFSSYFHLFRNDMDGSFLFYC